MRKMFCFKFKKLAYPLFLSLVLIFIFYLKKHPANDNEVIFGEKMSMRSRIKISMQKSWKSYRNKCFGENELKPIDGTCHDGMFPSKMGLSIFDSLDTLYIMGLTEDFLEATKYVESFDFTKFGEVSIFETNIRIVGGLLSAYFLTKNSIFLQKADEIASLIITACKGLNGLCYSLYNIKNGRKRNYKWANDYFILSEFGSLHLEFMSLWQLTKKDIYKQVCENIRANIIRSMPNSFLLSYFFDSEGNNISGYYSIGALADSFYEYLLKSYIITKFTDLKALSLFNSLIKALENRLVSTINNHIYFSVGNKFPSRMEHLACFAGGMYILASKYVNNISLANHYEKMAIKLTETCYLSYNSSATGLGSEVFDPNNFHPLDSRFLLRPETVESIFYLWRSTHDLKYRQWAEHIFNSLEKYCFIDGNGFSGLRDINNLFSSSNMDNIQQSYFLAETLKYLYLIFSDDTTLSLDQWVFNTEAHPFPIGAFQ